MATLQGKAVKNTYRQVLQIGANNVGVSGSLQPVQDGAGVNTALSLSTGAATINGNLTITGDLIITGGGIEIKELIDDTVAALITNGTGITWTYNDGANTLTGNFTGTTSVVPEGSNLYYTQGRFDSAFAAKSTTNLAEGTNLYFTEARGNANFATNLAASDTDDLSEGSTNLYYTNTRARTALSVTAGTGLSYDNTTGVFNLAAIPNASLTNSSITINGQAVSLGGTVTLTTTNIAEGTNLYWTEARGNSNFTTNLAASTTTNLAEGTNLYYTQARFDTAFSNKSTTNLAEGTNLYYTQARFNSALAAKTTTDLAEGTNLYYTDARARLALSSSATGLSYANNSGVFSLTAGYAIPTTVKLGQYDIAYNRSIVSAAVTGTSTKTLSLTQQDANVITATWTDQGITTINGTANQIAATTVGNTTTIGFTNDVTMPNNLVVSGNLTINGTATYVNTESISSKDPLFEVANTNNTTDAVDIGYYGRYYDAIQERVEFTGLFRDASDAGKFKIFTGLVDEPTNVVNTTGTGYTVASLVANVEGNLSGTANAANQLSTAKTIAASGDATWSVSFNGSANVSSALTLANTGVTATTYGTSTAVPTIAVDSKGRITSASNTNITFPVTTVNGQAGTVVLTTSDIAEGSNQYFTTARAQAAISGTAPISVASGVVSISQSGGASNGFLSSTDWNTFNNKQAALNGTGFVKISGTTISYDNTSYLPLGGGTLTGGLSGTTGTFNGILTTPQVKAATSAGLSINANSGTQVADFGAGGSANITFFGGLSGTSATFSGLVTATRGSLAPSFIAIGSTNNNGLIQFSNSSNYTIGGGTDYAGMTFTVGGTQKFFIANSGDSTFSNSVTAARMVVGAAGTSRILQVNTSGNDGIRILTSGDNPTLDLMQTAAANASARNWRIVTNWEGWGTMDFQSGTTNTQDPGTTRLSISGTTGAATFSGQIKTTATGQSISINAAGTGSVRMQLQNNNIGNSLVAVEDNVGGSQFTGTTAYSMAIGTATARDLFLGTNSVARLAITSDGYLKLREATSSTTQVHILRADTTTDAVAQVVNANISTTSDGMFTVVASRNTSNNTFYALGYYNSGAGNWKFRVADSGNVTNTNNSYGVLSDIKLKENIVDATPKLDDLLKVKIRNYNLIGEETKQIGVIAQELEQVFPSMVDESEDFEEVEITDEEGNTTKEKKSVGTTTKSVKMSVFVPMLIKAIQEQQAQIEELKALIAAK
jgi:hypothetical protein